MKISVVTVCYNAADTIERTMLSVLGQTYPDIEYIIIDGGSTDGTVGLIQKYADRIAYWVSEPDKGIYDAMNKGIKVATGEWINFMNAGDWFYNDEVIQRVFSNDYLPGTLVIYGKTKTHFRWGTYIVTPPDIRTLRLRMPLCHQSTFVRLSEHKRRLYDLNCKIVADYNFFHTVYIESPSSFVFYPGIIADYDAVEGVSANNVDVLQSETEKIAEKQSAFIKTKQMLIAHLPVKVIDILYRIYFFYHYRYKKTA